MKKVTIPFTLTLAAILCTAAFPAQAANDDTDEAASIETYARAQYQAPDCRDFNQLPKNPSIDHLECLMLQSYERCDGALSVADCKDLNQAAAERGLVSRKVAEQANESGLCLVSAPFMASIFAVCPLRDKPLPKPNRCDYPGLMLPDHPTAQELRCQVSRLKAQDKYTCRLKLTRDQCQEINEHAYESGVISKATSEQATKDGICAITPNGLDQIGILCEVNAN